MSDNTCTVAQQVPIGVRGALQLAAAIDPMYTVLRIALGCFLSAQKTGLTVTVTYTTTYYTVYYLTLTRFQRRHNHDSRLRCMQLSIRYLP